MFYAIANEGEIASQMRLQTFPDREDVPTIATGFPAGADAAPHVDDGYAVVRLVPTEPLSDRWYLVGLPSLPRGLIWSEGHRVYRGTDGFTGVRLRVGSQPAVLSLGRVDFAGKPTYVHVRFSEAVSAIARDRPWLDVRALSSPAACTVEAPEQPIDSVSATCQSLPADDVLQVVVRAFVSTDGSQSVDDSVYQLDPDVLSALPNGERVLYIDPRNE